MEQLIEDFGVLYAAVKELHGKAVIQHTELEKGIAECAEETKALKAERKGVKKIKDLVAYGAEVDAKALANRRASASLATQQEEVDIECAAKQKKINALHAEVKTTREDINAERERLRVEVKKMEKDKETYKKNVLDVLVNDTK